jgi:3',5'-cyclic-AMP phosphodiesterase
VTARVLQLTDLHLRDDPAAEVYGQPAQTNLEAVLDRARRSGPFDAVIATGDLADDGSTATYERLAPILASIAPIARWTAGNHDDRSAMTSTSAALSSEEPIKLGRWVMVLADSQWPGHDAGQLEEARLERLRTSLAAYADRPTLVAMHHPPIGPCPNFDCGLRNADDLLDELEQSATRGVASGREPIGSSSPAGCSEASLSGRFEPR